MTVRLRRNKQQAQKNVPRARTLRRDLTQAERVFWSRVRDRQLNGFKFRRQAPIGSYIADFVCAEALLIVEVDGGQHAESEQDVVRTRALEALGYRVVRFWNNDVIENIDGVLQVVRSHLGAAPSP